MAYNANREPPSAYCQSPFNSHPDSRSSGRLIVLSTGRGDVVISPTEARELAKKLLACAAHAEKIIKTIEEIDTEIEDGKDAERG